jgi:hypothetical protein
VSHFDDDYVWHVLVKCNDGPEKQCFMRLSIVSNELKL